VKPETPPIFRFFQTVWHFFDCFPFSALFSLFFSLGQAVTVNLICPDGTVMALEEYPDVTRYLASFLHYFFCMLQLQLELSRSFYEFFYLFIRLSGVVFFFFFFLLFFLSPLSCSFASYAYDDAQLSLAVCT
jgi:hypothetical protein